MRVIGIDCATHDARVGVARGEYRKGELDVLEVSEPLPEGGAVKLISRWLKESGPALLAIDAPLGWPAPMGDSLSSHMAGARITAERDVMFRRTTDVFVRQKIGKTPLDVGADRIARTAHAALAMLHDIRTKTGLPIPLAWDPQQCTGTAAIEVYPAATLAAHRFTSTGYKKDDQRDVRRRIVDSLQTMMTLPDGLDRLVQCPDVLDATVCLLAAKDFLEGDAMLPQDLDKAKREGWIWVRPARDPQVKAPGARMAKRAPSPAAAQRRRTGDVIRVMGSVDAADVAGRRVLCPACGNKIFENWPLGWDAHAHSCTGLEGQSASGRKTEFKTRFRHLFR